MTTLTVGGSHSSCPKEALVEAVGLNGLIYGQDGLLNVLVLDHHLFGCFIGQCLGL